ncbi:MAG TPA: carbon-nitrogen hydrolase family protein [Streptosporangiaceae bacterium]|nr:carbon-nitrogen hydrolase family protein [Streptosporangiaceae bacterium]
MRTPLSVAVAQPLCVPYDVAANAATHAAAIRGAAARVVVFPELSLTGYELDAPAITSRDPRLEPIVEACADTGSLALVGAPVPGEEGRPHIAMLAIDGAGAAVAYRKMWLSRAEAKRFTAGAKPAVLVAGDWRLGLAICKDTGVPEHASDTAGLGMDVYLAATLEHADEVAGQAERARRVATAHQVWVAVASFAGSAGGGYSRAAGQSAIWTPGGAVAAQAGPETGAIAAATLEP